MFQLKKFQFKKIKNIIKNLPKILAEHVFLTLLGGLLLSLLLGAIIFYQYSVLVLKQTPEIIVIEKSLKFDKEIYEVVLNEWQKRKEKFLEADTKKYPDPFNIIQREN
jgi:hypothetical protein